MKESDKKINLWGRDPLFKQLLNYGWPRVVIILCFVFLVALIPILLSMLEGNFINSSLKLDSLHDVGYQIQFFILLPFLIFFTPYYLNGLEDAFYRLRQSKVVRMDDSEYAAFVESINRYFKHPLILWSPYVVAAAVTVFGAFTYLLEGRNSWCSLAKGQPIGATTILTAIIVFLLYYLLAGLMFRIAVQCLVIRRFFSSYKDPNSNLLDSDKTSNPSPMRKLNINPLHPDKSGGLSPIGDLSLRISVAGIVVGICCLLGIASDRFLQGMALFSAFHIVILSSYFVVLSVVFFVPLFAVRAGMKEARQTHLLLISDHFERAMQHPLNKLLSETAFVDKSDIDHIENLKKLYEIAEKMPIYPFNTEHVTRFFGSVLWPVAVIFIKWLIDRL